MCFLFKIRYHTQNSREERPEIYLVLSGPSFVCCDEAMFWVFAVNFGLAMCFSAATIYFVEGGEWDADEQNYMRVGRDIFDLFDRLYVSIIIYVDTGTYTFKKHTHTHIYIYIYNMFLGFVWARACMCVFYWDRGTVLMCEGANKVSVVIVSFCQLPTLP